MNSLRAIGALLAVFFALCAAGALVFAIIDGITAMRHERWPAVTAIVRSAEVEQYHPFTRDSPAPTYSVKVRAMFIAGHRFVRANISSASSYRPEAMRRWADAHPMGSIIHVRYNPANPSDAELATGDLPRRYHAGVDLIIAAIFAALAAVLLFASRQRKSLAV